MTFANLKTLIESYSKRTDLRVNNFLDQIIELAAIRIGHDVRLMELDRIATLTVTDNVGLPDGYQAMRNVSMAVPRGVRTLTVASSDQFNRNVDDIETYTIKNGQIHIHGEGALTLNYRIRPEPLVADADTNFVLDNYPTLYLFGSLMEVWTSALDAEAFEHAQMRYVEEVEKVNANYDRQTFGANGSISRVDT